MFITKKIEWIMKKIFFPLGIFLIIVPVRLMCDALEMRNDCFTTAFTAGYVFKHDDTSFKKVYGRGMANVITGDICYYPWHYWGIGAKLSYWLANGRTLFFKRHTFLQEVPVTLYVRRMVDFQCCLQLYASLGGGAAWISEKSYLGKVHQWRGIGEVEVGLNYPIWCCLDFTSAFRYLFPRQSQQCAKADVGGFDLRAGIGCSF